MFALESIGHQTTGTLSGCSVLFISPSVQVLLCCPKALSILDSAVSSSGCMPEHRGTRSVHQHDVTNSRQAMRRAGVLNASCRRWMHGKGDDARWLHTSLKRACRLTVVCACVHNSQLGQLWRWSGGRCCCLGWLCRRREWSAPPRWRKCLLP